jgi:DNA-binding CsgD family transcriptional regulator
MKNLSEIIKKRSAPGILIFDLEERLLYSNPEAMNIMPVLGESTIQEGVAFQFVQEDVLGLIKKLKESSSKVCDYECTEQNCVVMNGAGNPCALRAFYIGHDVEKKNPTHIIVMIERIAETHEPDFNKAKLEFDLSKREVEVLRFICEGLGNKAISEELFISEYTVKDHIKSIMRKMNVSTRSEMIARLK